MSENLEKLRAFLDKCADYNHVTNLLYWDMRTLMPEKGFPDHEKAMTAFSTEAFRMETSDELYETVKALNTPEEFDGLDENWKFIVRRMERDLTRQRRIPADFYEALVKEQSESERSWEEAKNAGDFSIFAPHLEKMISFMTELAGYTDPGKDPYDVMLGNFEEGMDREAIDGIFEELKAELIPMVREILSRGEWQDGRFYEPVPVEAQREMQEVLLRYIGFDFGRGCTGESEHPFTLNLSSRDVRVTNHFNETNAIDPMFSAIHEGGHAIFEQNVSEELDGTVGGSCSYMGIHESQSRFYENILGRRRSFWVPVYGSVQELFPAYRDISLDDFVKEINHVRASFIRTEADEVTYCLHILIRYEMEKKIFREHIPVSELPELWNRLTEEYLGIRPEDPRDGILQDMHWSDGSFGYFPSYLLGSIYDGMFLEAMEEELGDIDRLLENGEIGKITEWLNRKIHRYGSTRTPKEVIREVCGRPLSAKPLLRYFRKKHFAE